MSTIEHEADDGARDQAGTVPRLLWGAGLVAAYAAGIAALHLALTWFHKPLLVAD